MASVLFAIGDYSEALKVFQAEAESQPRNAACWCNIAAIHLAMELNRACIKDCDKALELDRTCLRAFALKGGLKKCLQLAQAARCFWQARHSGRWGRRRKRWQRG